MCTGSRVFQYWQWGFLADTDIDTLILILILILILNTDSLVFCTAYVSTCHHRLPHSEALLRSHSTGCCAERNIGYLHAWPLKWNSCLVKLTRLSKMSHKNQRISLHRRLAMFRCVRCLAHNFRFASALYGQQYCCRTDTVLQRHGSRPATHNNDE